MQDVDLYKNLNLKDIRSPINSEMLVFERKFQESMKSKTPLLDKITHYIVKRKGKQMRPMFVFLSAGMNLGITDSTYRGATLIELLHTATLVHDDVVDESKMRRSVFSINALWKNKIAVLVGDYLLSKGLLIAVENKDYNLLQIVSDAVREMSEGELLQIEKARRLDITEEIYFEIIKRKTASLIASCCAVGAASSGADELTITKFHEIGENVGIAFQIKDDLFDYGSGYGIGKPSGIDIKEQKMTLPLIFALNNASRADRGKIINIVKNHNKDRKHVSWVLDYVIGSGGMEYARTRMIEYQNTALKQLDDIHDSEYKQSFRDLVLFTTSRKK